MRGAPGAPPSVLSPFGTIRARGGGAGGSAGIAREAGGVAGVAGVRSAIVAAPAGGSRRGGGASGIRSARVGSVDRSTAGASGDRVEAGADVERSGASTGAARGGSTFVSVRSRATGAGAAGAGARTVDRDPRVSKNTDPPTSTLSATAPATTHDQRGPETTTSNGRRRAGAGALPALRSASARLRACRMYDIGFPTLLRATATGCAGRPGWPGARESRRPRSHRS